MPPSCLKVVGGVVVVVGWPKILVSAPVPLELIGIGFDWVGAGPWGFGFGDGLDNLSILDAGIWHLDNFAARKIDSVF